MHIQTSRVHVGGDIICWGAGRYLDDHIFFQVLAEGRKDSLLGLRGGSHFFSQNIFEFPLFFLNVFKHH